MFISLVLNTEYGNIQSRKLFYFQNLKFCAKNNGIMISYEYMKSHYNELLQGVPRSLRESWDIDDIETIGVDNVEQYFIPDSLLSGIEEQNHTRTETLFKLFEKNSVELESCLQVFINTIKKNHPKEKIEGLFCVQEPLEFVREACKNNGIPLIPYFFSALRKPHGYRGTLYYVNLNDWLYSSNEPQERYKRFKAESQLPFILSHQELIALLGKIRTFPLLPYIYSSPKYELGICCEGSSVIPQFFSRGRVTDEDIFFDAGFFYSKEQIKVRSHSLQLDRIQVDRSFVHNDPASFLLSCKRVAAVRSQILLKALLWGRTTISYTDMVGFSYLCAKSVDSDDEVDLEALNWYLFGYLVPHDLMFSHDYWRWRLTKPREFDIYYYHIKHLMHLYGLPIEILQIKGKDRYRRILLNRIHDLELTEILCDFYDNRADDKIDFDNAISKFEVNGKSYWRINKIVDNRFVCHFEIHLEKIESILFYPFDDAAGIGKIEGILINSNRIDISLSTTFFEKVKGCVNLLPYYHGETTNVTKLVVDIIWRSESLTDYMKNLK